MLSQSKSTGSFLSLSSTLNEKDSLRSTRSTKSSMLRRLFSSTSESSSDKPKLSAVEQLEQLRRSSGHPSVQAYHV